jgi:hypothetical protein
VGLLFNFNVPILRHGIRRVVRPAMEDGDAAGACVLAGS